MRLPECEDMRDNKAIARIAEGYLKLLFPDLKVTDDEFIEYCVNPAVRMRQQVRDELSKMDQEFKWVSIRSERPDEFQISHPETKPDEPKEESKVDPLVLTRKPVEGTFDISDGQKGVSYEKLFGPYLKGAKCIKLVDPYIRYDYQIHNLINFCEFIAPDQGHIELVLMTCGDSPEQEVELKSKLDELQNSVAKDRIVLKFSFDKSIHDRFIEADNGWRIILGRGLDIYYKPEARFSLGFIDQTKRRCKPTTITYVQAKT
jgi:ATP-dependent Lon protease